MPAVYVLDVPEFAGLVASARNDPTIAVSAASDGYIRLSGPAELVFDRRAAGFKPAIWYSCLSGGVDGRIVEYGRDRIRIVDHDRA